MGFLDKAKKLAEQAQDKLDEVQKQFNDGQSAPSGPAVEYDQHGRPVASSPPAQAPGPPSQAPAPPPPPPPPAPAPPPAPEPAAPTSEPAAAAAQPDPPQSEYAPPKLSSGDPLAG